MLLNFPSFFQAFVPAMQEAGDKVGILRSQPEHQKGSLTEQLAGQGAAERIKKS